MQVDVKIGWEGQILDTVWGTVYYVVFLLLFALLCGFSAFTFAENNPDTVHRIVEGDTSSHFDSFVLSHEYVGEAFQNHSCALC